jgi:hypothetical protein
LAQAAGTTAVARLLETGLTDDVSIGSSYHVVALSKTLRVSGRARKAAPLFGAASSAGGEPLQACLSSAYTAHSPGLWPCFSSVVDHRRDLPNAPLTSTYLTLRTTQLYKNLVPITTFRDDH